MPIDLSAPPGPPVVHTKPFGQVPDALTASTDPTDLSRLGSDIFKAAFPDDVPGQPPADERMLSQIDDFRCAVGAAYLKLSRELDADIRRAYAVSDSFWKCMWISFTGQLRPQKHYPLCGRPAYGYGKAVTQLANMPYREELIARWKFANWQAFVRSVWKTKNGLMEKELEYRNAAMAVVQIGIGVGGMVLGVIGLLAGLLVPVMM